MTVNIKRRSVIQGTAVSLLASIVGVPARADGNNVIRFGDQANQIESLMEAAGQLKGLNYKVEFSNFPNAGPVMEAEKAGAIDAGFGGDGTHSFAFANGLAGKVIYAERSDPGCVAILVHGDSPIKTVRDLKGKSVAIIRGSVTQYLLNEALAAQGMTTDDVKITFLQSADAKSAFYAKSVDAWGTWTLLQAQAVHDGARVLVNGRGLINDNAFISASNSAITRKPVILQDFVNRVGRSRLWALENIDAYSKVWANLTKVSPEVCKQGYNLERFRPCPLDKEFLREWADTANFYKKIHLLSNSFDPTSFIDAKFNTDATVLADAKKFK
jgi:sulfonate transport system substrate-binding protein